MSLHAYESEARPVRRARKPASLLRFLTDKGGLKPCGELRVILDGAHRWMIRRSGMSLDEARRACIDAGYMSDPSDADGSCSDSTVNDLLDLIEAEARGFKQYPYGYWETCEIEAEAAAIDQEEVRPSLPARARVALARPGPARATGEHRQQEVHTMRGREFKKALEIVGLSQYAAAPFLGLSLRQVQRIAASEYDAPESVAKLLRLMIIKKLQADDVS